MPDPSTSAEPGPAQRAFLTDLERLAASDASVLVLGESGSGKSRAARMLHEQGVRREGPLVEVRIAALPPTLVEAELFGHEEGAFTGADRERLGRVRAADGGTLVLDGIETMALDQQVKLLRVLQERVVEPLGGAPVPVDVRVVATAGVDLAEAVAAGDFREDLYYRLAVVILRVPPLRSRSSELGGLVSELSKQVSERVGVASRSLSPAALERLRAHPWPGNLRELENALERVHVLAPAAGEVSAAEFEFLGEAVAGAERRLAREALSLGLQAEELTAAMLEEALAEQRGNVSAAARQVGLSRRAFEYRLKRSGESAEEGDA